VIIFDELEIISNKLLWLILICYSEFARTKWDKLQKACQDSRSPGWDSNLGPHEYEANEKIAVFCIFISSPFIF
jgi:hypothetical protein